MGPTVTRPVQDPLAIKLLDSGLHIMIFRTEVPDPYPLSNGGQLRRACCLSSFTVTLIDAS